MNSMMFEVGSSISKVMLKEVVVLSSSLASHGSLKNQFESSILKVETKGLSYNELSGFNEEKWVGLASLTHANQSKIGLHSSIESHENQTRSSPNSQ